MASDPTWKARPCPEGMASTAPRQTSCAGRVRKGAARNVLVLAMIAGAAMLHDPFYKAGCLTASRLQRNEGRAGELGRVNRLQGLLPGIYVGVYRCLDLGIEAGGDPLYIVYHDVTDVIDPQPLDKRWGALHVPGVLAIELHKAPDKRQRLLMGPHASQQISGPDAAARRPAHDPLPTAFDRYDADVLDGGLGAVAGAAGDGSFDLVGEFDALEAALDLDAERGGITD